MKKLFNKSFSTTSKTPTGSNQIWAMTSGKKDTSRNLQGHCIRLLLLVLLLLRLNQTYQFVNQMVNGRFYKFKNNLEQWVWFLVLHITLILNQLYKNSCKLVYLCFALQRRSLTAAPPISKTDKMAKPSNQTNKQTIEKKI